VDKAEVHNPYRSSRIRRKSLTGLREPLRPG